MESVNSRAASLRSALLRGVWFTIILTLLFAAAGAGYGWSRQRDTHAESVILLNPLSGNPFNPTGRGDSLTNMETEAQLVRSDAVAQLVQQSLGLQEPTVELLAGLDVNAPTNTQLLELSYADSDPDEAVRRAQAFAEQYLAFRESRSRRQVESQIGLLDAQIEDLQAQQTELSKQLDDPKLTTSESAVLRTQLDAATTQVNQLRAQRSDLQIGPFDPGQVVTPAAVRKEGVFDSWVAFAAIGAAAGLALALLIAIVRARLDTRVHHIDDIALAGRVLLGELTQADAAQANADLGRLDPPAELPASFRELRVSLLTSRRERPLVVLLASSSSEATIVPQFAPGLAVALAAASLRTVVVDTVGMWPLAERTAITGLEDYFASLDGPGEVVEPSLPLGDYLHLIPAGDLDAPDDMFMSPAMAKLLADLRQQADMVILIGGGVTSSRGRALANLSDVVLTEVRDGETAYRDLGLGTAELVARDGGVVFLRRSKQAELVKITAVAGADAAASDTAGGTRSSEVDAEDVDEATDASELQAGAQPGAHGSLAVEPATGDVPESHVGLDEPGGAELGDEEPGEAEFGDEEPGEAEFGEAALAEIDLGDAEPADPGDVDHVRAREGVVAPASEPPAAAGDDGGVAAGAARDE